MDAVKSRALVIILGLVFAFCSLKAYALDADLLNLPMPPQSQMVRKDKPVEINGVNARGTHLRCNLTAKEITDFYQDIFFKAGWELEYRSEIQYVTSFIKDGKYMYVGIQENSRGIPADVYLISSPADLAICRMLASMMQKGIMQAEAPGKDIPEIPRYPLSKRMVSIFAPEAGAITVYQAQDSPKEIADFYRRHLKSSGWRLMQDFNSPQIQRLLPKGASLDMAALIFVKGDDTLVINAAPIAAEATGQEGSARGSAFTIVKNMSADMGFSFTEEE